MKSKAPLVAIVVAGFAAPMAAHSADILCSDVTLNHMRVDSSYVSSCLASGVGNLTGNAANDLFLNGAGAGSGWSFVGSSGWTQSGDSGSFSLPAALWSSNDDIAIGFKFSNGNLPDEWFVYALSDLVTDGLWTFIDVFNHGGGLSHVNLYGIAKVAPPPPPPNPASEPGALFLGGLALAIAGIARRRRGR